MRPKRIKFPEVKTDVIVLDSGVNENVSSLEMKGGELIGCENYYLTEGSTGGYVSLPGFEVFDGSPSPAFAPIDTRETIRGDIQEVPGEGSTISSFIFNSKQYAFRNKVGGATAGLYIESPSGWLEIDTSATPLSPGGYYTYFEYNFLSTEDSKVIIWTNGVDTCKTFDGTTVTEVSNTGMGSEDKPEFCAVWGERLFLSYRGGSLQASSVGDPADFTTSPVELGIGYEITSLNPTVGGTLVVFCDKAIKILSGDSTLTEDWVLKSFTTTFGAYKYTVCDLFDTIIFMSDYGVTTLTAAQEYGDFAANSLSQKVKKTLMRYKTNITCAIVLQHLNQYRLYFDNGRFLVFSFLNKKLRGITKCKYTIPVLSCSDGKDSSGRVIHSFTSQLGYVYRGDVGTSFNGGTIESSLSTAFYHYKSPRSWKSFTRIMFEVSTTSEVTAYIRPVFDYSEQTSPRTGEDTFDIISAGSVYGEGEWGEFKYSGTESTTRNTYYFQALAANMSISFRTSSAFYKQHTIQNFIIDYTIDGRQM